MALFKATALIDGKETEVQLDDAKFITVDQANVRTKETVRTRLQRQAVNIRKDLIADPEFVNEVLASKGVDPKTLKATATGDGKSLTDGDVARLQEEWRAKELKPVQEQLAQATERFTTSNAKTLEAELTRALIDAGVEKSVAKGIASMNAGAFGFDDKSGRHAVKNGDAFAFSTNATDEAPYKGVDEYAKEWAAKKENSVWLAKSGQTGPNLGNTTTGGTGNKARSQMSDAEKTAFLGEHGFEAFMKLPATAAK